MGMFMAATWLGPALIMPSWSWVWKYMFEGRPAKQGGCHVCYWIHVSLLPTSSLLLCPQQDACPILSLLCLWFLGYPTAEWHAAESHHQFLSQLCGVWCPGNRLVFQGILRTT